MTRARASLVRGTTLAEIARGMDLGPHISLGAGEESTGGRERRTILAAVVEAVIGAVLLDRGEKAARRLVLRWLGARLDILESGGANRDSKSTLQEVCQKRGLPLPTYELIEESGPSHDRHYEVRVLVDGEERGTGHGRRKVEAEQMAAAQALASLESEES
jgi:ribonuclease-3